MFEKFNLELGEAERVTITGPSGSGKSTLLRCICGLDTFDSGQILLGGVDSTEVPTEKRGIGMIFQKPVLYHHLDVCGNLRLADRIALILCCVPDWVQKQRVRNLQR